ncbi:MULTISPECIES: LysM peptidoglycan-binding domain-containing protein [unclassified Burkholderia]|uniref:LysM peptidoglycan-binding domain-containing protein n=1 Tax=unclassified Burkholderia TaxID=2613784 RepID=UPI00211B00B9|nr:MULTISPECIES: LysM peptidoglycan-binding domain-containing protein [unclassified Burkholderia]MDN7426197.1 LysM peptidoglycan-binding domain-containing protein [Burkholderia sp. AU45388]
MHLERDAPAARFLHPRHAKEQRWAFTTSYRETGRAFAVSSIKGTDLKFAVTKLDGSNIAYKIDVRADDQDLLIYLNAAIAKLRQSPRYLDLLRKYFVGDQTMTTSAASGEHTYVVKAGDTLTLIAASKLGSGQRYREIQRRNNLANPNLIPAGQHLVIPVR